MKPVAEWTRRADTMFFSLPEEYQEPREFEEEDKLLLAKLYIDSFKVLSYLEFSALQALLIVQSVWDSRPDAPTRNENGYYSTHDPRPLSLLPLRTVFGLDDLTKFVTLIRSAIRKLPILESIIDMGILKEIKTWPETMEYVQIGVSDELLKFLGKEIRQGLKRDNIQRKLVETGKREREKLVE